MENKFDDSSAQNIDIVEEKPTSVDKSEEAPQKQEKKKSLGRRKRGAEPVVEEATPLSQSAPDTSALNPRQKELFALLPDTPFAVDAMTEQGVPVSEAVSTLTVLEIYGLVRSIPGGMFEKK